MSELDHLLPADIRNAGIWRGNELVLPFTDALKAISFATSHQIAILGLEAFEVRGDGLLTVDLADASRYIPFANDWKAYVAAMNDEAERWIRKHPLGEERGYILTSTSEAEFRNLQKP